MSVCGLILLWIRFKAEDYVNRRVFKCLFPFYQGTEYLDIYGWKKLSFLFFT